MKPELIPVDDIAFKQIDNIPTSDPRYILSDTKYPVIVVQGMENPYNKKYRMIDGRHRIKKQILEGAECVYAYVLSEEDIQSYINH